MTRAGFRPSRVGSDDGGVPAEPAHKVLAIRRDAAGRYLGTEVVGRGEIGALEGGVAELGHALRVDPYRLRCAIATGAVPSEFLGGGRWKLPGDVVERVRNDGIHAGRPPAGEDEEAPRSFVEQLFGNEARGRGSLPPAVHEELG